MMINTIPQHNLGVRLSPKIVTPKNTAVTGSKAPRIAVGVEPMYCTACVVQRKDIAVGKIANAIRFPINTIYRQRAGFARSLHELKKATGRKAIHKK